MSTRLYIGNLSSDATESDVANLFSAFGDVEAVKLMTDPVTGYSRGYGFVEMHSAEAAKNAVMEAKGMMFKDKPIWVSMK